eukprot:4270027-Amphidinium_carterae.1
MKNRCATRIGDDQMGLQNPIIGRNASGRSAPMMGRPKQSHARRNQELEAMVELAEHHSEMASTISQLMRAFK